MDNKRLIDVLISGSDEEYSQLVEDVQKICLGEDRGRFVPLEVDCGAGPEEIPAGRLLASLALLYPYRVAGIVPAPERFVRGPLSAGGLEKHMDATVAELYDKVDPLQLSEAMALCSGFLSDVSVETTSKIGTSISIKALFDAADIDPRIWELLHWEMPQGELGEMEHAADDAGDELIKRLTATGGEYARLLVSGAAVNKDQMRQALLNVGVKPGLAEGELIAEPIDTSFLRGMRNAEDYYICAGGARKALTTNFKQVKTSGYLSRKLVLLVAGHQIEKGLIDCGTRHGVYAEITTEDHASRLVGRYYRLSEDGPWEMARTRQDAARLVGETIVLRSPISCAGEHGVCHKCYGELHRSNENIHAGIYGVLIISEQITQRLLSSKHLLKARPTKIEWPQAFLDHFSVDRATITADSSVDRVMVSLDDVIEDDEEEGLRLTSVVYYRVGRETHRLEIPVPIYLSDDAWNEEEVEIEDGEMIIQPIPEMPLFHVPVSNTDLSEALHAIFSLIEREEVDSFHTSYARLMDLLNRSELRTPSVHAEMILRALVRDAADLMKRPDFSAGPDEPPYTVLKLTPAILNSPSITNSLAFERIKAQLTGTDIFNKTQPGILDVLFGA